MGEPRSYKGTFCTGHVPMVGTTSIQFSENAMHEYIEEYKQAHGMQEKKGASPILTWIVQGIATPIAWAFSTYSELQPSRNLVEGRLLGWGAMIRSVAILGVWTAGVLAAGWSVFRKRELALYSGH